MGHFSATPIKEQERSALKSDNLFAEESFPTMTIINMLDDYGYKAPTDLSSANSSQQRAREERKSHTRPDLIHSLNLCNLSSHMTPAPANTPKSSHFGLGFAHQFYDSYNDVRETNLK